MKLSAFALSATAAFVLSACGNGGTYQPTTATQPTLKPSATPPTQTAGKSNTASGSPAANSQNGKQPDTSAIQTAATSSATGSNASGSPATNKQDRQTDDTLPEAKMESQPGHTLHGNIPASKLMRMNVRVTGMLTTSSNQLGDVNDENKNKPPEKNIKHINHLDINSSDLETLVLYQADDKGVSLKPEAKGRRIVLGSPDKQSDTYAEIGRDLNHAVYGVFERYPNADGFVFVQGKATAKENVPVSGVAEYRGHALYRSSNLLDPKAATAAADARFTVDFGSKKLNGEIVDAGAGKNFKLEADIDGSTFGSSHDAKVLTHGNFYGANAEELAGVFKDRSDADKTYGGAFGAARQDQ